MLNRGVELSSAFAVSYRAGLRDPHRRHLMCDGTRFSARDTFQDGGIEFPGGIPHFVSAVSIYRDWECVIDKREICMDKKRRVRCTALH